MKNSSFLHLFLLIIFLTSQIHILMGTCTNRGWTKVGTDITLNNQNILDIEENNAGIPYRIVKPNSPTIAKIQKFVGGYWIDIPYPYSQSAWKIAFNSSDELYVAANIHVYKFDGAVWTQILSTSNGFIEELKISQADDVFIGGTFNQVDGITVNHIAKWDGLSWSALGSGVSQSTPITQGVYTIAFDAIGNLYAGGTFDDASGTVVNNMAIWDGSTWNPAGSTIVTDSVWDIEFNNSDIYTYSIVSGPSYIIERFSGSSWSTIYTGSGIIYDIELDGSGDLFAIGDFGTTSTNCRMIKYDGTTISCFAETDGFFEDLYINGNDELYVGGGLTTYIDNLGVMNFAKYGLIPENVGLHFDGVDDFVQVANLSTQFNFTTSAWFKASLTSNGGAEDRIFAYGGTTRLEVGLTNSGLLWVFDQDRGITTTYGTSLRDNSWHHVAITKSGPARFIYLDGVQLEVWNSPTTVLLYGPNFRIGNWTGGSAASAFFAGEIADVRSYDYSQTPTEIMNTMHCELSGNETNLRAWWSFEDGIGYGNNTSITQVQDYSQNSYDGSIFGFSLTGNTSNFICADQHFIFDNCCGSSDVLAPISEFCPVDIVVPADPGSCGTIYSYLLPTFQDNCDGNGLAGTLISGIAPGTHFSLGTNTVVYEYTDIAGNGPAQCSFDITVKDTQNPTMTCPNAVVPVLNTMAIFPLSYINFSDNCQINTASVQFAGVPTPYPYTCSDIGSTLTLTVTGQDMAGNQASCILNLTFNDFYGKCCPITLHAKPKLDASCAYTATDKIISDQVQVNSFVHYKAGVSICLLPGFDSADAATFIAEIETCN